jgi:hypothetical protein
MYALGRCALTINERLEEDVIERLKDVTSEQNRNWQKAAFGVRNMLFNQASSLLGQLIGRGLLLWTILPSEPGFTPQKSLQPESLFQEATGITLQEFIIWTFVLTLPYLSYSLIHGGGPHEELPIITGPIIRTHVELVEKQYKVIDFLTTKAEREPPEQIVRLVYNLAALRQRPLVRFEREGWVPVDLPFMKEVIPTQVFWFINDYLRDRSGESSSEEWRIYYGQLVEYYVRRLTSSVLDAGGTLGRRVFGENDWTVGSLPGGQHAHRPDITVLYPEKLVLIEVVATRLHFLQTAIAAKPDRLRVDFEQMIYKKVSELQGVIEHFRAGVIALAGVDPRSTKIYPVIVVADALPQFPLMWRLVFDELQQRGILSGPERRRLQVWDIDEFESILASLEKGSPELQDLAQCIESKTGDDAARFMPLQNYLYVLGVPSYVPDLAQRAFDSLCARVSDIIKKGTGADESQMT